MTTLMQIEEGEDRDLLLASLALADPRRLMKLKKPLLLRKNKLGIAPVVGRPSVMGPMGVASAQRPVSVSVVFHSAGVCNSPKGERSEQENP
jgi:hypothetical protein